MIEQPVILDLFCHAGGAGKGYADAGFTVIGCDILPQRHYPFEFVQGDALAVLREMIERYAPAAIHASPPCQTYSRSRTLHDAAHPDLVAPTREALRATGLPYVIENVEGADLLLPITLCGTEFDLTVDCKDGVRREVRRHRLFESNVTLERYATCAHKLPAISIFGHGGGVSTNLRGDTYLGSAQERRDALRVPWMNRDEAAQCIPPVYTEYVGAQLMRYLKGFADMDSTQWMCGSCGRLSGPDESCC